MNTPIGDHRTRPQETNMLGSHQNKHIENSNTIYRTNKNIIINDLADGTQAKYWKLKHLVHVEKKQ